MVSTGSTHNWCKLSTSIDPFWMLFSDLASFCVEMTENYHLSGGVLCDMGLFVDECLSAALLAMKRLEAWKEQIDRIWKEFKSWEKCSNIMSKIVWMKKIRYKQKREKVRLRAYRVFHDPSYWSASSFSKKEKNESWTLRAHVYSMFTFDPTQISHLEISKVLKIGSGSVASAALPLKRVEVLKKAKSYWV